MAVARALNFDDLEKTSSIRKAGIPKAERERAGEGENPESLFFLLSAEGSVYVRGLLP